jgi:HEAT repeat protein
MNRSVFRAIVIGTVALAAGWAAAQQDRTVSDNVADEDALIAILQSDAGWEEKHTACRSLRRIGTAKSVPALAALLPNPELSHMARFALEVMPFEEAGQALRDALETTSGLTKVGVITSLGARRDPQAVPLVAPLLDDSDVDVARAAAGTLGRIATGPAVTALMGARDKRQDPQHAVAEALLAAGQYLVEEGNRGEATKTYEALLAPDQPEHVRLGAFRGIAYAQPDRAPERVIDALKGDDPLMRDMAAQLVAEVPGDGATARYAKALADLPAETQVVLLRGLRDRGDAAARPAVLAALNDANVPVKLAAINALVTLGSPEDVKTLAALMQAPDEAVAGAARDALANMQAKGTDAAVVAAIDAAQAQSRADLLRLLAGRGADVAIPTALKNLKAEHQPVSGAAIEILGRLGGPEEAVAVLEVIETTSREADINAARLALRSIAAREGDAVLPALLAGFETGAKDTQVVVLRSLEEVGSTGALNLVLAQLENPALQDEAVRALSNWPHVEAAPHVLELARSGDARLKDTALRSYVRLAREEQSHEKKAEMLVTAMTLAERREEKWIVLSAWSTVHTPQALEVLLPYLDDSQVQNEAAVAIIAVASEVGKRDPGKAAAIQALDVVSEKSDDEAIQARAQDAANRLGK